MVLPHPLSDDAAELIAARFRLLSEPTRIRLLDRLHDGEATVQELAALLEPTPQNVSKHLGLLAAGGVVGRRKRGNHAYYAVVDDEIWQLCEVVCGGVERRLDHLRAVLSRS